MMAQTFEVNGQQSPPASTSPNAKQPKKNQSSAQANGDNSMGWGSSIEVGRLARAAEDALRRGNPTAAADYAERAVKAAPQDNKLWFLLGYTSRLAGRYQASVDAYQHGLQAAPGNADGLSGLAQTYARMGRTDDAKRLLVQVIRANPGRTNDLLIAGELFMRTGDTQEGINLLQRAEAKQPNAHAELMLAMAYLKLKQPDRAKQMLDLAKKHAPGNVEIFQAAANYYREEHDYKSAIATLKSAPKMTPPVLADLGYTLRTGWRQATGGRCLHARCQGEARRNWVPVKRGASPAPTRQSGGDAHLSEAGGSDRRWLLPPACYSRAAGQRRKPADRCDCRIQRGHQGVARGRCARRTALSHSIAFEPCRTLSRKR